LIIAEYVNQKATSLPPLHHDAAVKRGDGEILEMLLNAGADVNVVRITEHDSTSAESPSQAEIEPTRVMTLVVLYFVDTLIISKIVLTLAVAVLHNGTWPIGAGVVSQLHMLHVFWHLFSSFRSIFASNFEIKSM
jgi:hypothetical protein